MGMAVTQARLLTLTNRKNMIGYDLSKLSAQKMSLAREADAISTAYTDALNQKVLKWSNDAGATYYDLTYNTLMTPSTLNSYEPYMFTDMNGKVVVDDTYKKYAEMISPTGAPGGDYESHRSEILSELTGISQEDIETLEANNEELIYLNKEITEWEAQEPEILYTTAEEALSSLGTVSSNAVTAKTGGVGDNWDVTSSTTWTDIINSISSNGNYVTYLFFDNDDTMDTSTANSKLLNILNSFADVLSSLGLCELSEEALSAAVDSTYTQFTSSYAFDKTSSNAGDSKLMESGQNADDYYTMAHYHDKSNSFVFGINWDSAGDAYAVSLTNLLQVFLVNLFGSEEDIDEITNTSCSWVDLSSITLTDAESQAAHDEWEETYNELISERSEIEEVSSLLFDAEEEKLMDFYDAIFENIATNGWTYDAYINDTDYLNNVLQNGTYNITKAEQDSDGDWEYDTSTATTCQNVYQVSDTSAQNKATAEYEVEKTRLERKEETIDLEMQELETEQDAINEMLESYRSMIDDNVDRTFDVFS